MKILFVVKDMRLTNGVASYVMNYYRELLKNNDIKIDFLEVTPISSPYYEEIQKNGSKLYKLPSYKKRIYKIPSFLKKLYREEKYDIVHSNVINSATPIMYYAKKYGVPVRILHSHATQNGDSFFKSIIRYPFEKKALRNSNCYFACSNLAGEKIFKNKNFFVINNAINIKKYEYNLNFRKKIRDKYRVKDKLIIMTAGRFTKQKNPWFIIEIVKQLTKTNIDFELWWFGNGELENEIKQLTKQTNTDKFIKFFGAVKNVNEFYSAADLFILPSFYEGLPVVGIEAQISGLQCLFSETITKEVQIGVNNCKFLPISSSIYWIKTIKNNINYDRLDNIKKLNLKKYVIEEESIKLINIYKDELKKNKEAK